MEPSKLPQCRFRKVCPEIFGPQQCIVSVFASFLTPYEPIAPPIGDVWLDRTLTVQVGSGGVDAQRRLRLSTTIPRWAPSSSARRG